MVKEWTRHIVWGGTLAILGCTDPPPPSPTPGDYSKGWVVLNEGLFQQNNAGLSFYSFSEQQVYPNVFLTENGRGLGDTANDMTAFSLDGKDYIIIAVDVSSQLEIVDAHTLKSVAQLPVFDGSLPRSPREVIVQGERAYCCNYDGTVAVVDLRHFAITQTLKAGKNPDGIAAANGKIYVANSGGLDYPRYDSTITVIDAASLQVDTTISSRINCRAMLVDSEEDLYVVSAGDYAAVPPAILRIHTSKQVVVDTFVVPIGSWDISDDDWIYYYDTQLNGIYRFNALTETFDDQQIVDCSDHRTVYGIHLTGDGLLTLDANHYVSASTVRYYGLDGTLRSSFTAGLNAAKILQNK